MSLIYTEGYLESETISSSEKELPKNISKLLLMPQSNNKRAIKVDIYDNNQYLPLYELYILSNMVVLENLSLNKKCYITTNGGELQLYYFFEKEDK